MKARGCVTTGRLPFPFPLERIREAFNYGVGTDVSEVIRLASVTIK